MATFTKRNNRWRAQIILDGRRQSKSFPTKAHAMAWANLMERENSDIITGQIPNKKISELLERYGKEVSIHKGGARCEWIRIKKLMKDRIAEKTNRTLTPQDIANWRDRSLQTISGSSVNREWNILSVVFTRAIKEWGWMRSNPMTMVKRPKNNPARTRRPTQQEITDLLDVMCFDNTPPIAISQSITVLMLFAIETAMRTGEMCNIKWEDLNEKSVHLPKTKNGHSRDVPLSPEARQLIDLVRPINKDKAYVFNLVATQVDANFRKAKKKANIDDLHFHDFRREALTRLAKKVDVMTLAKISGHRSLQILLNVYYAPSIDDVADLL